MTQTTTDREGRTNVKIIDTPYRTRVNQRDKNGSPEMKTVASRSTSQFFFSRVISRAQNFELIGDYYTGFN